MKADEKRKADIAELEARARRRLLEARRQKAHFELDMREGYFFAAPHRMRSVNSTSHAPTVRTQDAALLQTSFAFELCDDFPTVMINTFFPETMAWVKREPGPAVPADMRAELETAAAEEDKKIFASIRASNFYEECGKSFNPDLALGTVALWIDQPVPTRHPVVQTVPIRELEINVGPDGKIGDRFVVRHTRLANLDAVLPGKRDKFPKAIIEKMRKDDRKQCAVVWAFLPLYDEPGRTRFQYVLTIDNLHVESNIIEGEGALPLVIGRMGATPEWAWALGPLIKALPELRMMDELAGKKIKNVDLNLEPPISYPNNSFANIQNGIEAGFAYPIRPGEEDAIKNIYDAPPLDPAIYLTQDLETRLRRLFFLDWPQQDGKTPPTATQWIDEMTMAQRRIGTPGRTFYAEFCIGVFMRFLYLAEKAGIAQKITTKDGREIAMLPYNPAQRSAEQEDVALFSRFAQIGAGAFPEEWKIATDGAQTLQNIARKFGPGVLEMWAQRDQKQVAGAIDNIAKVMGGTPAGAPAMPQGAPPPADLAGPQMNQPTFSIQGQGL